MRELIYIVVETFYKKVIGDVLIGYHFEKFRDPEVLEHHLQRLTSFWEMQLTGKMTVPLDKGFHLLFTHLQLRLNRGELGRWILLFHQTLDELQAEFDKNAPADEAKEMKLVTDEWKERIAFFEERFKSHPQMFQK
jgi:hemoglobin